MTDHDLDLFVFLAKLADANVWEYAGPTQPGADDEVQVKFFPKVVPSDGLPLSPRPNPLKAGELEGMCVCGHDLTEHGDGGFCLRGCEAARCSEPTRSTT